MKLTTVVVYFVSINLIILVSAKHHISAKHHKSKKSARYDVANDHMSKRNTQNRHYKKRKISKNNARNHVWVHDTNASTKSSIVVPVSPRSTIRVKDYVDRPLIPPGSPMINYVRNNERINSRFESPQIVNLNKGTNFVEGAAENENNERRTNANQFVSPQVANYVNEQSIVENDERRTNPDQQLVLPQVMPPVSNVNKDYADGVENNERRTNPNQLVSPQVLNVNKDTNYVDGVVSNENNEEPAIPNQFVSQQVSNAMAAESNNNENVDVREQGTYKSIVMPNDNENSNAYQRGINDENEEGNDRDNIGDAYDKLEEYKNELYNKELLTNNIIRKYYDNLISQPNSKQTFHRSTDLNYPIGIERNTLQRYPIGIESSTLQRVRDNNPTVTEPQPQPVRPNQRTLNQVQQFGPIRPSPQMLNILKEQTLGPRQEMLNNMKIDLLPQSSPLLSVDLAGFNQNSALKTFLKSTEVSPLYQQLMAREAEAENSIPYRDLQPQGIFPSNSLQGQFQQNRLPGGTQQNNLLGGFPQNRFPQGFPQNQFNGRAPSNALLGRFPTNGFHGRFPSNMLPGRLLPNTNRLHGEFSPNFFPGRFPSNGFQGEFANILQGRNLINDEKKITNSTTTGMQDVFPAHIHSRSKANQSNGFQLNYDYVQNNFNLKDMLQSAAKARSLYEKIQAMDDSLVNYLSMEDHLGKNKYKKSSKSKSRSRRRKLFKYLLQRMKKMKNNEKEDIFQKLTTILNHNLKKNSSEVIANTSLILKVENKQEIDPIWESMDPSVANILSNGTNNGTKTKIPEEKELMEKINALMGYLKKSESDNSTTFNQVTNASTGITFKPVSSVNKPNIQATTLNNQKTNLQQKNIASNTVNNNSLNSKVHSTENTTLNKTYQTQKIFPQSNNVLKVKDMNKTKAIIPSEVKDMNKTKAIIPSEVKDMNKTKAFIPSGVKSTNSLNLMRLANKANLMKSFGKVNTPKINTLQNEYELLNEQGFQNNLGNDDKIPNGNMKVDNQNFSLMHNTSLFNKLNNSISKINSSSQKSKEQNKTLWVKTSSIKNDKLLINKNMTNIIKPLNKNTPSNKAAVKQTALPSKQFRNDSSSFKSGKKISVGSYSLARKPKPKVVVNSFINYGKSWTTNPNLPNVIVESDDPPSSNIQPAAKRFDSPWGEETVTNNLPQLKQTPKINNNQFLANVNAPLVAKVPNNTVGEKRGKNNEKNNNLPITTSPRNYTAPSNITTMNSTELGKILVVGNKTRNTANISGNVNTSRADQTKGFQVNKKVDSKTIGYSSNNNEIKVTQSTGNRKNASIQYDKGYLNKTKNTITSNRSLSSLIEINSVNATSRQEIAIKLQSFFTNILDNTRKKVLIPRIPKVEQSSVDISKKKLHIEKPAASKQPNVNKNPVNNNSAKQHPAKTQKKMKVSNQWVLNVVSE